MPQPQRLDYSNRDLRNRSFRNKDLTGADFSGADIRGCNFSGATLVGANFQQVRTGQSRKQFVISLVRDVTLVVVLAITGAVGVVGIGAAIAAIYAFSQGTINEGILSSGLSALFIGLARYIFRELSEPIRTLSGTMFEGANLTNANFGHASIQNTDFTEAKIDFVDWIGASFARCKFSRSFDDGIRSLCTSRDGYYDYRYANLKNLDLARVILASANLAGADLSGSKLDYAILERANLHSIQASGTDFSSAVLTGASIQNWGINADTRFTNVRCDYIYLEPNEQARKPASGSFAPGDFAKLVNQFSKTLDFLFRNGIEPQAFDVALRNLLTEYEDAGLSLQAVVDVGDGDRLVKLNVANPTADHAPMHAQFTHDYEAMQKQLEAARDAEQVAQRKLAHAEGQLTVYQAVHQERSVFLQGFVYQAAQSNRTSIKVSNAHFAGDLMSDKRNEIQFGNVQGDVSGIAGGDISGVAGKDITGAAGGNISGTLTLTLGQLEASKAPEALKLADLLKQLKAAIEKPDAGLDKKDQEKALKHLDAIGKLGNDPKNADLLEKAGDALDALPTIIKRGNGLMEFAEKYLPTITASIKTVLATGGIAL